MPLFWQLSAGADEPKTADEVIAKHIEAIGGQEKLDSVKTMRITGKAIGMGGMEIPVTAEFKRPKKVRFEFTMQGMTGTQAFDGETGWSVLPFTGKTDPEKMSPDMVEMIKDRADFYSPLVDYKKKGHTLELVGKDDIEGSETYKLKLTKKNGDVEYHFLDTEYFILIQTKGKREFQGTETEFTTSYGDYKEVNGILLAHAIQQGGMGGNVTFEKIEVNIDIPDERFTMPEVKKEEPVTTDAQESDAEKTKEPPSEDEG
jgi:outer membrane lipoprotein-sorting protein